MVPGLPNFSEEALESALLVARQLTDLPQEWILFERSAFTSQEVMLTLHGVDGDNSCSVFYGGHPNAVINFRDCTPQGRTGWVTTRLDSLSGVRVREVIERGLAEEDRTDPDLQEVEVRTDGAVPTVRLRFSEPGHYWAGELR